MTQMFLRISYNSCPLNLLLVQSHQQGRSQGGAGGQPPPQYFALLPNTISVKRHFLLNFMQFVSKFVVLPPPPKSSFAPLQSKVRQLREKLSLKLAKIFDKLNRFENLENNQPSQM